MLICMASTATLEGASVPQGDITQINLFELARVLWSWQTCSDCSMGQSCTSDRCPTQRMKSLACFFQHYQDLVARYEPGTLSRQQSALSVHEIILASLQHLKSEPELTRAQLVDRFSKGTPSALSLRNGHEHVINIAVKITVMVNCSAQGQPSTLLEEGLFQKTWRSETSFVQFITDIFTTTDRPSINEDESKSPIDMRTELMARNLKRRIGLRFRPTDDLRRHLKLDRKENVVDVFHHTAYLKEHLRLTKDKPRDISVGESLRL